MTRLSFVLVGAVLPLAGVIACASKPDANHADSASGTAAGTAGSSAMVRGTVDSVSAANLVVTSDSGKVTLRLASPVQVFDRKSATLADVKDNTFIGVTTVKQPDGTEQATEIHIFPEALRGLGEGSRMMAENQSAAGGGGGNRMTNGAVSASRMTNGSASPASRMTNGSVSGGGSSTMVVQYAGGSQKVTVPPNTPVTELAPTSKALAPGDRIVALATRNPDGSLGTNRVLLAQK
ncbi:MAG TPA: hypothetical protein VH277_03145 [Gemmatimonadaceae bacterium]|nr:hypothetical protein [Gemmatimonadaceae bacterium]